MMAVRHEVFDTSNFVNKISCQLLFLEYNQKDKKPVEVLKLHNVQIEELREEHLRQVLDIYTYYVLNSTATFHMHIPAPEEMREIVFFNNDRNKSYVLIEDGEVCGYAILSKYGKREAYDNTAEVTVYLKHDCLGKGLGRQAVSFLEKAAKEKGFHALIAIICGENVQSIALFERCGYFKCAHYKEVGKKFDRLLDVVCYEKIIG